MPSYRLRWRAGCAKRALMRRRCGRSGYAKPTTARSGVTPEANGFVFVTKDEDFGLRVQATVNGPAVVWLRAGNTSNAALCAWFIPRVPHIVSLLDQGTRLVEIR